MNTLYYGDNLPILREYIPDESVDLIYLDPPFNSNRSYNVLFKNESGTDADAQITAFDDTWHWGPAAEATFHQLVSGAPLHVAQMLDALRQFIGENQMMAYLVMMAARLVELHRVLKPTGSLYLHCDPTASHYLKLVLDTIFLPKNFKNEIIWKRQSAHSGANRWGDVHDTILFYTKDEHIWNPVSQSYGKEHLNSKYRFSDERGVYCLSDLTGAGTSPDAASSKDWRGFSPSSLGRHWAIPKTIIDELVGTDRSAKLTTQEKLDLLDQNGYIYWALKGKKGGKGFPRYKRYLGIGIPIQDTIIDIHPINSQAAERLGYPTQKPLALLERIIQASSNPGDLILDPFSGCGTAIAAAQKLGRRWIGIDITHLAINMHKYRLKDMFALEAGVDYQVIGEPTALAGARQLAREDRYQFQWWALSLIHARPLGGAQGSREGKKGADRGIDGLIPFIDDNTKRLKYVAVQVKSGKVSSATVRDLRGVLERDAESPIAVLVTLEQPSQEMVTEAVSAGYYESPLWQREYPRLQILTIEELLDGAEVKMPPTEGGFKKAPRVKPGAVDNPTLGI